MIAGTVIFALIYAAIGTLVGSLVSDSVNGTVLVLFVWILDVFFGPAFGALDLPATRGFPTHFVTLWMVDLPSRHGAQIGDLGWALVWVAAAIVVGGAVTLRTSRVPRSRPASPGDRPGQLRAGMRTGVREATRNRVLWPLLVAVPVVFVLLAVATTPDRFETMQAAEDGGLVPVRVWLPDVHGGTIAPIAIGSLAALVGLCTVVNSRRADRRLTLAGFRRSNLLTVRLLVVIVGALLATAASLAATAVVFEAAQWGTYFAANVLLALTYALIGALLGPVFARVGGVLIAFLLPFIDLGIEQSAMLHPVPAGWAHALPGYGASRGLVDAALTSTFDEWGALYIGLVWLAGPLIVVGLMFRTTVPRPRRSAPASPATPPLAVVTAT